MLSRGGYVSAWLLLRVFQICSSRTPGYRRQAEIEIHIISGGFPKHNNVPLGDMQDDVLTWT